MFSKHQRELFTHDSHVLRQWQTHRWITNTSLVSVVYRLTCIRQTSLCWMWVYCEEFKAFSFHTNLQTETKHSVWHLRGSPGNMNYYVQPSHTSGIDLVPRCKHKDDKQRKRHQREAFWTDTVQSAKRVSAPCERFASAFIHCVVLFVQLWCFCWSFYTPTLSPGHDPGSRWKVPIGGRPL